MSDLAITAGGLGTGIALGSMVGVASRSVTGGLAAGGAGIALGGLATWLVDKGTKDVGDGSIPRFLHPGVSTGALAGAGLGVALGGTITGALHFANNPHLMPTSRAALILGAAGIAGAAAGAMFGAGIVGHTPE